MEYRADWPPGAIPRRRLRKENAKKEREKNGNIKKHKCVFWTDARVVDEFTPEDKYFYLYVLTNPHTNLAGCYEISIKQMVNETGYNRDTVERLLDRFGAYGLLEYSRETRVAGFELV